MNGFGIGRRSGPQGAAPPRHLSNIQILRGIAALMVLVYHIGNELSDRAFPVAVPEMVGVGSAGVDIFFVISGFIMVHSTAAAFGKPGAPLLFLLRRIVRLVPLYWIVTTCMVAALALRAGVSTLDPDTLKWAAASYAFLFYPQASGNDFPFYAQGWTLNFEMLFYLGFTVALWLRRSTALCVLSIGFLALSVLGWFVVLPWPVTRWTDSNSVEFVLGIALAEIHARGIRLPSWAATGLASAGALVFALTIYSVDTWLPARGFVWGPPALAIVAAAALYSPQAGSVPRRALEALGDASYSLYLVHYAFFTGLAALLARFRPIARIPVPLYCTLCFVGAIGVAFAVYHLVEKPMTRSLDHRLGLSRRWRAATFGQPRSG